MSALAVSSHHLPGNSAIRTLQDRGLRNPRGVIRCPVPSHGRRRGDQSPSLSVAICDNGRVLLSCKAGCSLDAVLGALGLTVKDLSPRTLTRTTGATATQPPPCLPPRAAETVWRRALARAQGSLGGRDREVERYLEQRGLSEAHRRSALGVLATDQDLPVAVAWWPLAQYRIVVPLYDQSGHLVTLQVRAVEERTPKTLFPRGSRVAGTVFASKTGLELLRSQYFDDTLVLYGEGLTDYLAYVAACPFPVLCAPGTSVYVAGIGDWARDRVVLLAPDADAAGMRVANEAAAVAYARGARRVILLAWKPPAKDACDYVASRGVDALRHLLAAARSEDR